MTRPKTPICRPWADPGQPFPGNKIPSSLIDPNAALFFSSGAMPLPKCAGNNFSGSKGAPTDVPETILRFDHYFSDKLSVMGHYIHDNTDQQMATSLWSSDTYPTIGTEFQKSLLGRRRPPDRNHQPNSVQ